MLYPLSLSSLLLHDNSMLFQADARSHGIHDPSLRSNGPIVYVIHRVYDLLCIRPQPTSKWSYHVYDSYDFKFRLEDNS